MVRLNTITSLALQLPEGHPLFGPDGLTPATAEPRQKNLCEYRGNLGDLRGEAGNHFLLTVRAHHF